MCDVVCRGEGWCGWPVAIGILVLKAEKDRINLKRQRFMRGNMTWLPDEELGKQGKKAKELGKQGNNPESIAHMARELRWKLKKQQHYMNHLSSMHPGDDSLPVALSLGPLQRLSIESDELSLASGWSFKKSKNQMEGENPQSLVKIALRYYIEEHEQNPLRQTAAPAPSRGTYVI